APGWARWNIPFSSVFAVSGVEAQQVLGVLPTTDAPATGCPSFVVTVPFKAESVWAFATDAKRSATKITNRSKDPSRRSTTLGSILIRSASHSRQLHSCQATREARLAHLLEHFFHLRVLAEKIVYFLHAGA